MLMTSVSYGGEHQGIIQFKAYLSSHLHMNLSLLRYFLEIEVVRSRKGLSLSQQKYLTNLLEKWVC